MISGIKIPCYSEHQEKGLELGLNPEDNSVLLVEAPFKVFTCNIEDLKRAIRQLELE